MQWDDLRVFLAVARDESLSGAGRRLRIDPATVGRRIARLEEQIGTTLFAKSPQGYALTDAGERLLDHALRAEQAVLAASEEIAGQASRLSGQIRIGAPDGVANFLLPQVCAAIQDDNPELEIQIVALPRLFNLSRREADMAVTVSAPSAGRLLVQKITDYRLHLAASQDYLDRHGPIPSVAALRDHRMIGYIPDMIFDKELDYLNDLGGGRVPLASNSVVVQFHWLRQGGGVGIVHDFALPSAPDLRRILTDQLSLTRSFHLVRHADDARLERMNRFAALLSDGLRQEVARLEAALDKMSQASDA
ncbi:transcriptional regulator, LysR family [Pseudooceanicola nitratireducens]|uniref:Transcriptional regulator, LysR family n=1 Tax=Pseudooceanicola nitratireducens TaxID=517719 RepID=A0A1I1M7R1_9RHOB|nr:LysR family transcriptional regulator [Pseudooceanicola nitratireducens]SEI89765.1 DNA-binding transcriptional regulator, LysR family [Pseudooceanicola nitratireducens]SFC81557.1 transcriptional regulator, LysR family [Pseudooceanicola nitratireducens]